MYIVTSKRRNRSIMKQQIQPEPTAEPARSRAPNNNNTNNNY